MSVHEITDSGVLDERLRTTRQRGQRRLVVRRVIALIVATLAIVAVALPTLVLNGPSSDSVLASLRVPDRYAAACANEPHVCLGSEHGLVPDLLKRSLHFPVVREGASCPATRGAPVATYTSYFGGTVHVDGSGPAKWFPAHDEGTVVARHGEPESLQGEPTGYVGTAELRLAPAKVAAISYCDTHWPVT